MRGLLRAAGVVPLLVGLGIGRSAHAQTYSQLYSFQCVTTNDGDSPYADLIADSTGNLYGTTKFGGDFGYGTVFEVSPNGTETVLYSFAGPPNDGSWPRAGVVRDQAGDLYGTTSEGGEHDQGTVFEVSAQGTETVLHNFFENKRDGAYPLGRLLLDGAGNLYGTTSAGGTAFEGTVFRLSPTGTENVLSSFTGFPTDGQYPAPGVIPDNKGNLYGTTTGGGVAGDGTVFELTKDHTETVLYSFSGPPDGEIPFAGLVRDAAGNVYGTTPYGGRATPCPSQIVYDGCGTVFKLAPSGQETLLYTFTGGTDGGVPYSDLIMDPKGNLYGTASQGGSRIGCGGAPEFVGCGVVFEITTAGKERVLYTFNGGTDGAAPYGGLLYSKGALYGTTTAGGTEFNCGTVFKVTP